MLPLVVNRYSRTAELAAAIAELGIDVDKSLSGFGRIASTACSFVGSLVVKYFHNAVCFAITTSTYVIFTLIITSIKSYLYFINYEKIFSKTDLCFRIIQKLNLSKIYRYTVSL